MNKPAVARMLLLLATTFFLGACTGTPSPQGASTDPQSSDSAAPRAPAAARKEAQAPIESAEIIVRESAPPQYALRVVSGLPSGCARFSRIDVKRQDTVIDVTVWNSVPADSNVMCTMIYGTADNTAELGTDFKSGQSYDVRVNGESKTRFTAQ
jgi:hypothetical protein